MLNQPKDKEWGDRFDEQFPIRIYGVAGEPKTEFITTENTPDKIKAFISATLTSLAQAFFDAVPDISTDQYASDERIEGAICFRKATRSALKKIAEDYQLEIN